MKKTIIKRKIAGVLVLGLMFLSLTGCGGSQKEDAVTDSEKDADIVSGTGSYTDEVTEGEELLCLAESREEAQKIADQYGIELVEFSYGVATFHTLEDPQKVIDMGLSKGYPELSINGTSHIY